MAKSEGVAIAPPPPPIWMRQLWSGDDAAERRRMRGTGPARAMSIDVVRDSTFAEYERSESWVHPNPSDVRVVSWGGRALIAITRPVVVSKSDTECTKYNVTVRADATASPLLRLAVARAILEAVDLGAGGEVVVFTSYDDDATRKITGAVALAARVMGVRTSGRVDYGAGEELARLRTYDDWGRLARDLANAPGGGFPDPAHQWVLGSGQEAIEGDEVMYEQQQRQQQQ